MPQGWETPDGWELLKRWGLPDGPARPGTCSGGSLEELRTTVLALLPNEGLPAREQELFVAWLSAFQGHFPTRYEELFGEVGRRQLQERRARVTDRGRYVKLRRIAARHLCELL